MWNIHCFYRLVILSACLCLTLGQVINTRGCRSDVCFVLDESGSIGITNWVTMINFVSDFIEQIHIAPDSTLVGVVKFSSSAILTIRLDAYTTNAALEPAVDALATTFRSGGTSIHDGIRVAMEYCFSSDNGARSNAPDIMILLTDGQSSASQAQQQADLAHNLGIQIITVGIGHGVDENLLRYIAEVEDNYYSFDDFGTLLQDASLILGRSCLAAQVCEQGQILNFGFNDSYPDLSDCPTLENPELVNRFRIEFVCTVLYNTTDPDARFEVNFLFDGQVDPNVSPTILAPPAMEATLDDTDLIGNVNKYISCQVRTYFNTSPHLKSTAIFSRSYWAGIAPSVTRLVLQEGDVFPKDLYIFSSLPITCPHPSTPSCSYLMTVFTTTDDIAVVQVDPDDLDVDVCRYRLRQMDWKEDESLAYDLFKPLKIFAKRDSIQSLIPRVTDLYVEVENVDRSSTFGHPLSNLRSDKVSVLVLDDRAYTCRIRYDPWYWTFDGHNYAVLQQGFFVAVEANGTACLEIHVRHCECPHGITPCSMACAVAVREDDYAVAIDRCNGTGFHFPNLGNDNPLTNPNSILLTANHALTEYQIETAGGVRVIVEAIRNTDKGINIWIEIPPSYKGSTSGLCGNYDGLSSNDVEGNVDDFIDRWRLPQTQNLFRGVFGSCVASPANPNLDDFCSCTMSNNDATSGPEQIDDLDCGLPALQNNAQVILSLSRVIQPRIPLFLRQNVATGRRRKRQIDNTEEAGIQTDHIDYRYFPDDTPDTFEGEDSIPSWADSPISEDEARGFCEGALQPVDDMGMSRGCNQTVSTDTISGIVSSCMGDIRIMGNTQFVDGRKSEYEKECILQTYFDSVDSRNSSDLTDLLDRLSTIRSTICPNSCSGQGVCENSTCVCDTGFTGPDCSFVVGSTPVLVEYLEPAICDVRERPCQTVQLRVQNVYPSASLTCRVTVQLFGGEESTTLFPGTQTDLVTMTCPLPDLFNLTMTSMSGAGYTYSVSVSSDAVVYSSTTGLPERAVVDTNCMSCDDDDVSSCEERDDACFIEGECFAESDVLDSCYWCDPSQSTTSPSIRPGASVSLVSNDVLLKTPSDSIVVSLEADDPDAVFSLLDQDLAFVSLDASGNLQWLAQDDPPTYQDITIRITGSDCPRSNDVTIRLITTLCEEICGPFLDCVPTQNAPPGKGDYTCHCSQPTMNLCVSGNPCQNGGTCRPLACNFMCQCHSDYNGTLCQERLPDVGSWSIWSEFSECSKPCDYGVRRRTRSCLRAPCDGDGEESILCNSYNCQEDAQESNEGATLHFDRVNIQELVKVQEELETTVAELLSVYCSGNIAECCTSVLLRVKDEPELVDMVFMRNDVDVASGYPKRTNNQNVELKIVAMVELSQMAPMCELTDPEDVARSRRQTSEVRPVSRDFLERALEASSGLFVQEFGETFDYTIAEPDTFQTSVLIPASAAGGALGLVVLIALMFVIRRKCKEAAEKREEELKSGYPWSGHGELDVYPYRLGGGGAYESSMVRPGRRSRGPYGRHPEDEGWNLPPWIVPWRRLWYNRH